MFADGGRYEGEFVNGKMQGRGLRVWANGGRYVFTGIWTYGCFREGQRWATVGLTAQACGFQ